MEASSAVNTPHPDDEAEAFFGDGDEVANGDSAAQVESEPTEQAPEEDAPETSEDAPAVSEDAPAEPTRGPVSREYIVFQRVPLTRRALEHMLKEIEAGNAPEPRLAYMELDRPVARNDKQAVAEAYKTHRDSLGEKCSLAAVSARSFRERTVKPRSRPVEEALDIS